MQITRENYEEYALDWMEGTLREPRSSEMHRFLAQNPDIADVLSGIDLSPIAPNMAVEYAHKDRLMAPVGTVRRGGFYTFRYRMAAAAIALLILAGTWWAGRTSYSRTPPPDDMAEQKTVPNTPSPASVPPNHTEKGFSGNVAETSSPEEGTPKILPETPVRKPHFAQQSVRKTTRPQRVQHTPTQQLPEPKPEAFVAQTTPEGPGAPKATLVFSPLFARSVDWSPALSYGKQEARIHPIGFRAPQSPASEKTKTSLRKHFREAFLPEDSDEITAVRIPKVKFQFN